MAVAPDSRRSDPAPVDAVVFDLGNVLIAWDPHPAIASAVGAEQATRFLSDDSDFDFMAWNHQQDSGRSWDEGEAIAFTPGAVARSCDIGSGIVAGWSRMYSQRRLPGMRCQSYPCGTENLAMPRFTWPAMSSYSLRPITRTRAVDDALLLKANSTDIPSVRKRTSSIGASESPTSVMFPSRDVTDIATISPGSATVVKRAAF